MGQEENKLWSRMVRETVIPDDGLTLDGFAALVRMDPSHIDRATWYLHRRKLLWRSEQRGHVRIFPASMIPGRGRPLSTHRMESLMPTQITGLMVDILPTMASIAMLHDKMPDGGWQDEPELQTRLRRSIATEAERVMKVVRKFIEHRGYSVSLMRRYLWLVWPTLMAIVVETQPDLALGDAPLSAVVVPLPKKVAANLPADERVFQYVEAAGVFGIAAYEIVTKTGGRIKRDQVEEIAFRLEDSGMLFTAEARAAARGPKGLRLYSKQHGKPLIGSDGRRLPPLKAVS
jgi:hypothetical protein